MEFSNGINAPKENYGKGRKMISVMDILADEPIIYGNIRNSVQVDDKTESKNKVENGDLVFVRSSEIPDEVGWAKAYRQEEYALYSGFSIRGKKKSDFDAKFIELSLNNSNREQIERKAGGSTRFNVSQSILKSIEILEPSIEEQIEIGNFFERLDDTIALHQQELTTLKQTKQGFLQKMFPKEGAIVPKVRFPGFTGDWKEKKLTEVAKYRNGKAHEKNISYNGKYIVINSKFVSTDGKVKKFSDEQIEPMHKNEIAFVLSDVPNGRAIARTFLVKTNDTYSLNQRIAGITPGINTDAYFLYILMNRHQYFLRFDDGVGQTNLSKKDVESFIENYPSLEEQQKIGTFFKQLDDTIALHQCELDTLNEAKKAFLQKMFA
ncbi:restriction endonuclease subunit S [Bacillus toyonensis]|uniref:restriction endonuclease subunit S n=1 Tax=Bacillus toyonensis TaxID=155322 RepID=UPI000BF0E1A8|nr:methyltransferase type 11 [Bacillus toyonensis]